MPSGHVYLNEDEYKALRALLKDTGDKNLRKVYRKLDLLKPDSVRTAYREEATDQHINSDGDIVIEKDALVSCSDEGAYVMAWVWVYKHDVEAQNPSAFE